MSDKQKSAPDQWENKSPEKQQEPIFVVIEQLRSVLSRQPEVLRELDMIAKKLQRVSDWVKFIIGPMLRWELSRIQAGSASSTAAILAANDTSFGSDESQFQDRKAA